MKKRHNETAEEQYKRMTESPVNRLIVSLAIPTVISMLITMIYSMADAYFVSKISVSASGATGIVFSLMAIFQAFGFMFGQGAGSNISRRLGAKDVEAAKRYCSTAFFVSLVISGIILAVGLCFLDELMVFLGSTDTILPYARDYGRYILIAGPALTCACVMNNILRYEGMARLAMIGLTTGGVLNIALDPILIFGLDMGISGAGLATAVSNYISMAILLFMFVMKKCQCRIRLKYLCLKPRFVWDIMATGLPSFCRNGLNSLSTMILNQMAATWGDACIAAMSVASRCAMLIFSVAVGIGQGFQPVCGFNYGSKKYDRVRQGIKFLWLFGTLVVVVLASVMIVFAPQVIALFRKEIEVVSIGKVALRYLCVSLMFLPTVLTANMTFQSAGKKGRAFFLACCQNGIFFIPLVLVLPRVFGLTGLEVSQPIAYVMATMVSVPFLLSFMRSLKRGTDLS